MANVTIPRNGIPIGFVSVSGQRLPVDIHPEYLRAFSSLTERVGGVIGPSTDDLALSQFEDAGIEEVKAQTASLRDEFWQSPPSSPTASGTMFRPWSAQSIDLQDQIRGSGTADPGRRGFWPDQTGGANLHRLRDRVQIGGGSAFTGNLSGTQGSFVAGSAQGAAWAPRDSSLFVAQDFGLMAVTGFVSNANIDTTGGLPTESIGVAGFAIGNKASRSVWGLYSDVQFEAGSYGYGIEIAVKNKGADATSAPYFATTGTYGIWLPGGGDATYGGSPVNPSNTAIAVGKNSTTWNKGIVFFDDALTRDGSGYAYAVQMASKQIVSWDMTGGAPAFYVFSDIDLAGRFTQLVAKNTGLFVIANNGKSAAVITIDPAGVNFANIKNAATGSAIEIAATGDDTNIDFKLTPKGTGLMQFGTHTVNADAPVVGYITIKDSGGTTRKLACIA